MIRGVRPWGEWEISKVTVGCEECVEVFCISHEGKYRWGKYYQAGIEIPEEFISMALDEAERAMATQLGKL